MGTTQMNNGSKKFKNIDKKLLKFYADIQPNNKDKQDISTGSPSTKKLR
jgi:hypothetical protein